MYVYLNGQMVDQREAKISVGDAGLQHSVGLFETMGVYHGRVFRVQDHLQRLANSAATLGLTREIDLNQLSHAIEQTIEHNRLDHARLRLTVTAGTTSLLRPSTDSDPAIEPTVLVTPNEPITYDPAYFEQGVAVIIASSTTNPFDPTAGHKTLAYWQRLRTLRQAASTGAGEAIWLTTTNHIASGAVSNIFLVKDEQLFTPIARGEEVQGSLPAPVLPGITRATIIELAENTNISVTRRMLQINDLLEADEVFLTNSGWLMLPVNRVEKKQIGDGNVGPITRQLRTALLDLIDRETNS